MEAETEKDASEARGAGALFMPSLHYEGGLIGGLIGGLMLAMNEHVL